MTELGYVRGLYKSCECQRRLHSHDTPLKPAVALGITRTGASSRMYSHLHAQESKHVHVWRFSGRVWGVKNSRIWCDPRLLCVGELLASDPVERAICQHQMSSCIQILLLHTESVRRLHINGFAAWYCIDTIKEKYRKTHACIFARE